MKYLKKANIYKASNVTFDPKTCQAYSYGWWRFLDRINGKVVFNNYNYSPTTGRHQGKVRQLLVELGIHIDLDISVPEGLQSLDKAIPYLQNEIRQLQELIKKPRTHKVTNQRRAGDIVQLRTKINQVKELMR
jgi:hypothetical protein